MKIQITSDGMAYNVRLNAADPRDFGHLLNLFKLCVADNCRSYSNRVWRVEKRAQGQLSTFIGMAEDAGATIIRTTQQRAVVTLKEMAQAAQASAHTEILTISDTDESGAVLEYR